MTNETNTPNSSNGGNPPVHEIRMGALRAAIWENQGKHSVLHSVQLTCSYKDGDAWKETSSLRPNDLLVAAKVLDHAHTWIAEVRRSKS